MLIRVVALNANDRDDPETFRRTSFLWTDRATRRKDRLGLFQTRSELSSRRCRPRCAAPAEIESYVLVNKDLILAALSHSRKLYIRLNLSPTGVYFPPLYCASLFRSEFISPRDKYEERGINYLFSNLTSLFNPE